jgi:lysophospholipase L1-like esterase
MRHAPDFLRLATALTVAATAAMLATAPARAQSAPVSPACVVPNELNRLDLPLTRTARRIAAGQSITIVAIGSSSTSGAGASSPAMNYPSRLEAELKLLFPRISITVINRGVGGETAPEMLARFDSQVFAENPDIVIWQLGSNSVLRDQPVAPANDLIRQGVKRLKATGIDVILMNPQYAPKVIAKPDIDRMVDLINAAAKETNVNLFQRFAMMRYWRLTEDMPFSAFLSPDELHLNDWSYGCIAKMLAREIADAVTRPTVTAGAGAPAAR